MDNSLQSNDGKFITEEEFLQQREMLSRLSPKVVDELRNQGVMDIEELKVEFFFYTNTAEKAKALAEELKKLDYDVMYELSGYDNTKYLINGWTTKMPMADGVMANWAKEMCEIGYKFDCEFDGWGTCPDQEDFDDEDQDLDDDK